MNRAALLASECFQPFMEEAIDATSRICGCTMADDQRPASRQGQVYGTYGRQQPVVRKRGALDYPHRGAVARPDGAFQRVEFSVTAFHRWYKRGVLERVCEAVNGDSYLVHPLLDLTIMRAHQHRAGVKGGSPTRRSAVLAGGMSTKIHAAVNADGQPVRLRFTAGHRHDMDQVEALIYGISPTTSWRTRGMTAIRCAKRSARGEPRLCSRLGEAIGGDATNERATDSATGLRDSSTASSSPDASPSDTTGTTITTAYSPASRRSSSASLNVNATLNYITRLTRSLNESVAWFPAW